MISLSDTLASLRFSDPHPSCRSIVVIPARNEQDYLTATLDALRLQVDGCGHRLPSESYEVLLLLNNCTDASVEVAAGYAREHPDFVLHWAERTFPRADAHVGTARRVLMDTAYDRLRDRPLDGDGLTAILSTDADTIVASDWIFRNLQELQHGADAVGGAIHIAPSDLARLHPGTRSAYENDRDYQVCVARLESLLDPDAADPWPRHLQHFGASLACTPEVYLRAGRLPAIKPLEDVAFVDALRRCDARVRHATSVRVTTSSRLDGRAEVGLSGQLGVWYAMIQSGEPHTVHSCAWLVHRFAHMHRLRQLHAGAALSAQDPYDEYWRHRLQWLQGLQLSPASFLQQLDCDYLIEASFRGEVREPILDALRHLEIAISRCSVPEHPAGSGPDAYAAPGATPAVPSRNHGPHRR